MALILNPLNPDRDRPHFIVQAVKKISRDIANGCEGFGKGTLVLGNPQRFLVVTAFMQTADRWVIQSVRREMPVPPEAAPQGAEDVLRTAKTAAKIFFDRNR